MDLHLYALGILQKPLLRRDEILALSIAERGEC